MVMWVNLAEPPEGPAFRRAIGLPKGRRKGSRAQPREAWRRACKAQISRIAELECSDGIVEAIDPVLFTIFGMVPHPSDQF